MKYNSDFGTEDFFAAPINDTMFMSTDGVGSKIELECWDTIGYDCVAMNVNDIICVGARPTAFVNYIKMQLAMYCQYINDDRINKIAKGLLAACNLADVKLIGGETAIHGNDPDVSGTVVGELIHHKPIYGQNIGPGDKIIGIESGGIHSNGFTELRKNKIVIPNYFSEPTYIYSKLIVHLVEENLVTGLVNVTGGGMNNIHRLRTPYKPIIPLPGMLDKKNKHMNDIYNALLPTMEGKIIPTIDYMKDHFNMGWGFIVVCKDEVGHNVLDIIEMFGYKYNILGAYE